MKQLPIIIPVVSSAIDWRKYIDGVLAIINRSPTRSLDAAKKEIGSFDSFICSLSYISSEHHDRIDSAIWNHLSFSFIIEINKDQYLRILQKTNLHCSDNFDTNDRENIIIVSGTILDWRVACIEQWQDFNLRFIFDSIYLYFNQQNLMALKKIMQRDNTFLLEEFE